MLYIGNVCAVYVIYIHYTVMIQSYKVYMIEICGKNTVM